MFIWIGIKIPSDLLLYNKKTPLLFKKWGFESQSIPPSGMDIRDGTLSTASMF
jgi:hypothetical protein